jgi:hypothetical protein
MARALLPAAAMAAAGCFHYQKTPTAQLNRTPLIIDPAMQMRDWPPVTAEYADGNVPGWYTRFHYHPSGRLKEWTASIEEPIAFIGGTVLLPVTLFTEPAFTPIMYAGLTMPSSYNAMPAIPPTRAANASSANGQGVAPLQ